jgi:hypothetical protein
MVCGTRPNEACVIERTPGDACVREMQSRVLTQANHYVADRFRHHNAVLREKEAEDEEPFYNDSGRRQVALERALAELGPSCTLEEVMAALGASPVLNKDTSQQMVFCPAAGAVRVRRPLRA